ncbi:MAG TPA: helix-turn-helix domain-containing protein, partial [Xanthobacteraceae bacterium]
TRFGTPGVRGGVRISLRISQEELGRLIGATREMVNKCLRDWAKRRIVRHGRGLLVITNAPFLEAIAGTSENGGGPRRSRRAAAERRAFR